MFSANWRRWLLWAIVIAIAAMVATPFVADYSTLKRLQDLGRKLRVGMSEDDVLEALGPPYDISQGWFGLATSGQQCTDTVWTYCTLFDWDGTRGISSYDPRPYWWTRLSPEREYCDAVLDVWFRDGKVIGVTIPWEGTIVE